MYFHVLIIKTENTKRALRISSEVTSRTSSECIFLLRPQPKLLLTACEANEFTCADGHCIPKSKRCDSSLDCSDQSDERECNRVAVPEGYSNKLPPPRIDGEPIPLYTMYSIRTIRSLDLQNFQISIDLSVEMKYLDTRLQYRNLQEDRRSNKLDKWEEVWSPNLKIVDGTRGLISRTIDNKGLFVFKSSEPLPDDDSTIYEGMCVAACLSYNLYHIHLSHDRN